MCLQVHMSGGQRTTLRNLAFSFSGGMQGSDSVHQACRVWSLLSCCCEKYQEQSNMERKGFISPDTWHLSLFEGNQSQSSRQELGAETMAADCLLQGAQSATTWVHPPRDGITHRGLDPPTSVSNQLVTHSMLPQMWSQDPLIWPVLQLRSLFS